jgi:HEPN domain-containing protein
VVWLTILFGIVLGFVIAGLKEFSEKKQYKPQASNRADRALPIVRPNIRHEILDHYRDWRRLNIQRMQELSGLRELSGRQQTTTKKGKNLVENWRKSIVGLFKLAERNLTVAKEYLDLQDNKRAVQAASTSVENISYALIHCFGEKPVPGSGQEEALRMLSRRFGQDDKIEFEEAISSVASIEQNKKVLNYLSTHKINNQIFNEARTRQIVESASNIVGLFKRIITERFVTEIPELGEACPKCRSMNISVWGFNGEGVRYNCNVCRHRWTEPRT